MNRGGATTSARGATCRSCATVSSRASIPPTGGGGPVLVLTNLAGHRYPSGTGRRALRIDVRYDDEAPASNQMLLRLTDSTLPTTRPTHAALSPGEQRRIDLPTRAGAACVVCDVTFERNRYVPGSYELLLHTMGESLPMNARRARVQFLRTSWIDSTRLCYRQGRGGPILHRWFHVHARPDIAV
jgi:hypothetical protein